jgi:hypothetical protein
MCGAGEARAAPTQSVFVKTTRLPLNQENLCVNF